MPQIGGVELADSLQRSFPSIKVLFTTGYSDEVLARHETLEVETSLIQKPFTPAELARKMRDVLG